MPEKSTPVFPWTEEPGGLQFMGLQRVRHDCATEHTDTVHACIKSNSYIIYFCILLRNYSSIQNFIIIELHSFCFFFLTAGAPQSFAFSLKGAMCSFFFLCLFVAPHMNSSYLFNLYKLGCDWSIYKLTTVVLSYKLLGKNTFSILSTCFISSCLWSLKNALKKINTWSIYLKTLYILLEYRFWMVLGQF